MIKQIIGFVVIVSLLFKIGQLLVGNPELNIMGEITRPTLKIKELNSVIGNMKISSDPVFTIQTPNNKTVIRGGYLSCYKSKKSIDANGDSFYKVKTDLQKQCHVQNVQDIKRTENSLELSGNFEDCQDVYFQSTFQSNGYQYHLDFKCQSNDQMDATVWLYGQDGEAYTGLGEQFSHLRLENRPYSLLVREKGVGRGDQPLSFLSELIYGKAGTYYSSYSPIPIWYSLSRKIAFFTESLTYMIWWNNVILTWDSTVAIKVIDRHTVRQMLQAVLKTHGHTAPTPDWVNQGAIVGLQDGTQAVMSKYNKVKNGAIAGLWLQDWVGKRMSLGYSRLWWNWQIDQEKYKQWDKMRQSLQSDNVSLLIYINPMLTNVSAKAKYHNDFFTEAVSKGYLVKHDNGNVFLTSAFSDFQAGLIDLYNSEARSFYKTVIRKALESTGARGMMTDFGQAFPLLEPFKFNVKKHNSYPVQWLKLVHQTLLEQFGFGGHNGFFTFSRAGYWGSPKHTRSLWAGDQNMNYGRHNGLPSCLVAMLSSGLSGYLNTHCDIGGYVHINVGFWQVANRDSVQMERWLQLAAFSPVFRSHEGNRPQKTMQVYDDEIAERFCFWSQVFRALAPYRKEQKHNLPLVRPLFLHHKEQEFFDIWDQFYLGDWLMVAPILSHSPARQIFIPKGKWIDLWTGEPYTGCTHCTITFNQQIPFVLVDSSYKNKQNLLKSIKQLRQKSRTATAEASPSDL